MKMSNKESISYQDLATMEMIVKGFLNDKKWVISEDGVQTNKLDKEIEKLKKEVKKWKNKSNKLSRKNKKILKELEEYREYYDRFDILDFGGE